MQLIEATQAAKMLGVSTGRLYELARIGILPVGVIIHIGRQIRVDQDALREWVRAGGQSLPGGWRREPEA